MRIGLIADIHGNLVALETVHAALTRGGVDEVICLGDVAVLGPQPAEVISWLSARKIRCVMGNTDVWLVPDCPVASQPADTGSTIALTRWCARRLTDADVSFLRHLPMTIDVDLPGGRRLVCFHGSPRSVDHVIAATSSPEALASMALTDGPVIFAGGHTHIQLFRRHGAAQIVNPGSVGLPGVGPGGPDLPVNRDVSWAEYAVLDAGEDYASVDLRRIEIDVARVLAAADAAAMPEGDWWTGKWHVR